MHLRFVSFTLFLATFSLHSRKISSAQSLIEAMQSKYAGKWSRSITFVQYNTHYQADTIQNTSLWYEAIEYPDKFRIDFGEPREGNAVIFANDSVFNFKAGELVAKRQQANTLMLLAGGIYFVSADKALSKLQEAGYMISKFHEATWEGKPAYVVGAEKGDLQASQFWIDKAKLYLVRTITLTPDNHIQEARFSKHIKTAGGWTETEVVFLKDGKRQQLEVYKDIKVNRALPSMLFNASHFGKVHWIRE
jgi:outer membrane lipoprotein-sorting protein